MYGTIVSDWKISNRTFEWRVEVPANTTATVYVPAPDADGVLEAGEPTNAAAGVKFLRMEGDRAVFEVGSGRYVLTSPLPSLR
jgi:alpha-L-rhamnosidase